VNEFLDRPEAGVFVATADDIATWTARRETGRPAADGGALKVPGTDLVGRHTGHDAKLRE
jgi:hypothetical protein